MSNLEIKELMDMVTKGSLTPKLCAQIREITRILEVLEKSMTICGYWSRVILLFPFFWVTLRRGPRWGWRVMAKKDGSYRCGFLTLGWIQFGVVL